MKLNGYEFTSVLIFITITTLSRLTQAFTECSNGDNSDPNINGVSSCLSWAAYLQSTNVNVTAWCQDPIIQTKCCLTCNVIYKGFSQCLDSRTTCSQLYQTVQGNCTIAISGGFSVSYYCPKSCGKCNGFQGPVCQSISNTTCASNGYCTNVTYFGVSTVNCVCNSGYTGAICETLSTTLSTDSTTTASYVSSTTTNGTHVGLIVGLSVSIPLVVIIITAILLYCFCKDRIIEKLKKNKYINKSSPAAAPIELDTRKKRLTRRSEKSSDETEYTYYEDSVGSRYYLQPVNSSGKNSVYQDIILVTKIDETNYYYENDNGQKFNVKYDNNTPGHDYYTINSDC